VINNSNAFQFILSVDSENLLRVWDINTSITVLNYRIPLLARVTAVAVDESNKYLAVGSSAGEAKILNLKILSDPMCVHSDTSIVVV
jgi:WD40 repeat protein